MKANHNGSCVICKGQYTIGAEIELDYARGGFVHHACAEAEKK